ncbi:unnamed protein product [Rotaria socialis]|uniref:Cyclic nucleotide-binding domain-containing protein n=1 Tax=Rotaria socialis TaxID=392032 RepID=A0A820CLY4_9BILA|nr:unnamed protein product [Rotaria socialis]CAF3333730.1 unnamed protein product [Rotaria socialis]CAF3395190.1 unnamed protein product [Rotaria socialis]CAF3704667.1 unnamed protein product [Rotaria socialis]CAF4223186.1 unnamed protein product [Rotaria socialis]
MAQASSFKSSIRYQVCNSTTDNDISPPSPTKPSQQGYSSIIDDDLCEIRISPTTNRKISPSVSSPNHHASSLTHLIPSKSSVPKKSSSTDSTIIKIPIQPPSLSPKQPLDSSSSDQFLTKRVDRISQQQHQQQQQTHQSSTNSSIRDVITTSNIRQSTSRQSALDAVTTKLPANVRKNSIIATTSPPAVQQHLSPDNENLFSTYQGDFIRQSRQLRKARRQDIKARFEKFDLNSPTTRRTHSSRRFTFIFDPSGRLAYWWTSIISLAFLYNFWIIIFRFSFHELTPKTFLIWFILDYSCDFLYLMDIMFNFRTAYLEEGVLQTDPIKLRHYYMNTTRFYIDCLCLMPLDFLYLSIGFKSVVRLFRLVKIYRFWTFLDRTERHTNYPNLFRTIVMIHYLLAIFHWNACFIYILHTNSELSFTRRFSFTLNDNGLDYFRALYWSITTLTLTQNHETKPASKEDYIFLSVELIFALLLFATIMGHVASIVSNLSNARKDFQAKLDAVKTYMSLRRVPNNLEDRVIRWFDYLWMSHKSVDDNQVLSLLPYKLRAEIAIHVHLDTLKRVEIFQNTEAGFLNELVLRLKPVLFSPGDFICRKGEVGREMYIVNRGKLHVMADNNKTVLATLKAGSYFGEISILNMGSGNRRTASVRSVGYSDLFCLSKEDLWEVLKEYPAVRVKLEAIAVKRLEKHKKPLIQQVNLKRSKSAPGLIEANCRLPFHSHVRRTGSGFHRLPSVKETDVPATTPSIVPSNSFSNHSQQPLSASSNSLLAAAPLATSISVTSSLNYNRQRAMNHSVSWSMTTDTKKTNISRIGRATSLNHSDIQSHNTPLITNEIERLKKRLIELE